MKYLAQFKTASIALEKVVTFIFVSIFLIFILILAYLMFKPSAPAIVDKVKPMVWFEPLNTTEFNSNSFTNLATQIPNFNNDNWQETELPIMQELPSYVEIKPDAPMSRLWLSFDYKTPRNVDPSNGVALYGTRIMGGSYAIYINDRLVFDNRYDWHMQWNHPIYFQIPALLLKDSETLNIKIAVPYKDALGYAVGSLYIGDVGKLKNWSEMRYLFSISFPWWCSFLLLILGFMSLHLYFSKIDKETNWIFFSTSIAYFVCTLQFVYDIPDNDTYSIWYGSIVDSSTTWFIVLASMYILTLSKRKFPKVKFLAYFTTILISIITLPVWQWNASALIFQHQINMALIIGIAGLLLYLSIVEKNTNLRLLTISLWLLVSGGIHDIGYMTSHISPDSFWVFGYSALPFMFIFIFMLQRSYINTYKLTLKHNKTITEKLEEQELRLSQQQAQIISQEKIIAVANERDRFMRDIHDGIGGILISTLRAAENNQPITHISEMIKDCLIDLENIILSLEPNEYDITTLLGSLRHKLHKRLDRAGVEISWQIDDLPTIDDLDATKSLSILRIIQEAITNSLKHSQCSMIFISAQELEHNNQKYISITITDNGKGFEIENISTTNGLKNMKYRANKCNCELDITTSDAGTKVKVLIASAIQKPNKELASNLIV